MCKFIGKVLCKLSKSEILRLYSIVRVAMKTTKTSNFTCQSKSFISVLYFSLAKFQLVRCNLSLATIWQMTYTHKLPKLCAATSNIFTCSSQSEFTDWRSCQKGNVKPFVPWITKAMERFRVDYFFALDNELLKNRLSSFKIKLM